MLVYQRVCWMGNSGNSHIWSKTMEFPVDFPLNQHLWTTRHEAKARCSDGFGAMTRWRIGTWPKVAQDFGIPTNQISDGLKNMILASFCGQEFELKWIFAKEPLSPILLIAIFDHFFGLTGWPICTVHWEVPRCWFLRQIGSRGSKLCAVWKATKTIEGWNSFQRGHN